MIDFATSLRSVVLPALGGETIIPLCPLPIGQNKSIALIATEQPGLSKESLLLGKIGVRSSKLGLLAISSGSIPLIDLTNNSAPNLSVGFLTLVLPTTISPVLSENLLICDGAT